MKCQREWFIHVPWGKLALKSHGHPDGDPVFLVHGRQDSLSVFDPLIEQMSENFYYVALDMPGNGLSDAFPHGPKLQRFHFLYAMELAILHLGWDKFIFIGHSMGCEQGLFYNVIYPGRITKMVLLDAGPTLMRMQVEDNEEYQRTFYDDYYSNYMRECFSRKKYTINRARQAIMKVRELTEDQCSHILSRNFKELGIHNDSQEQLPNDHSFKEESPNNGPKTVEVADGTQNLTDTEIKKKAQKANKKDYEAQNAFEAEKEYEAHTSDRAAHEYHQRHKSNGPPNICASFVEGRKVKAAQKTNEARNAVRAPKTIEARNAIRERNAIRARNAYRARMANDAKNAEEARKADEARNADGVTIPPGAEEYIRFIDDMRKNDAVGYLSWDNRLKNLAPQNYGNDYYFELFKKIPPTLLVAASNGAKNVPPIPKWRQGAKELLDKMATLENFHRVDVEGSHDVHYTHPERVLPYINAFLKDNKPSSKL